MTKKIGIPCWNVKDGVLGVSVPYLLWAKQFGKVKILMYDELDNDVDVLVLPGGADVNSLRYGQKHDLLSGSPNQYLETFDQYVLPEYIQKGVPIFGICRGMQTLAVYFGDTMNQHLDFHGMSKDVNDLDVHELVYGSTGQKVKGWQKNKDLKVGSWHHQSVNHENGTMKPILYASNEDVIEAMQHTDAFISGVQWHPERNYDPFSHSIMEKYCNL